MFDKDTKISPEGVKKSCHDANDGNGTKNYRPLLVDGNSLLDSSRNFADFDEQLAPQINSDNTFMKSETESGLQYDWAQLEYKVEEDKIMAEQQTQDGKEALILKLFQERLFQRYNIPKINPNIEALREFND